MGFSASSRKPTALSAKRSAARLLDRLTKQFCANCEPAGNSGTAASPAVAAQRSFTPTNECIRPAASRSRRKEWKSSGRHIVHSADA
jgi:hypothetical protein